MWFGYCNSGPGSCRRLVTYLDLRPHVPVTLTYVPILTKPPYFEAVIFHSHESQVFFDTENIGFG